MIIYENLFYARFMVLKSREINLFVHYKPSREERIIKLQSDKSLLLQKEAIL